MEEATIIIRYMTEVGPTEERQTFNREDEERKFQAQIEEEFRGMVEMLDDDEAGRAWDEFELPPTPDFEEAVMRTALQMAQRPIVHRTGPGAKIIPPTAIMSIEVVPGGGRIVQV